MSVVLGSSRPSCSNPTSASLCPFPSSETWNQSLSGVLFYRAAGPWGKCLHHPPPLCVHGSHPKISGGEFIRPLLSFKMNLICTAPTKPHLSLPAKVKCIQPKDVKRSGSCQGQTTLSQKWLKSISITRLDVILQDRYCCHDWNPSLCV